MTGGKLKQKRIFYRLIFFKKLKVKQVTVQCFTQNSTQLFLGFDQAISQTKTVKRGLQTEHLLHLQYSWFQTGISNSTGLKYFHSGFSCPTGVTICCSTVRTALLFWNILQAFRLLFSCSTKLWSEELTSLSKVFSFPLDCIPRCAIVSHCFHIWGAWLMVADPVGGNTYFKNFMNGFPEAMKIVVYQTCQGEEKLCSVWHIYVNRASKSI